MSSNRESAILIGTLLATLGVVAGGLWWIKEYLKIGSQTTATAPNSTPKQIDSNCQIANAPKGLFSYGGSTAWAPIRRESEPIIARLCPHFRLRYTDPIGRVPGSQTGIDMLIDGQLAFSQSSHSLTPENIEKAQARGIKLKQVPVAIDAIAIAVHPQQQVSQLTIEELRDIYTGKLTNWKQLGGANLEITPYSRPLSDSGTVEFFTENVLQNGKFAQNVEYLTNSTLAIRRVAKDPGAIYYASAPEMVYQCSIKPISLVNNARQPIPPYQKPLVSASDCPEKRNQLNKTAFTNATYPITRRIFAIVKIDDRSDGQAGEAYAQWLLTDLGQKAIEQAGFVPLN